MNSNLRFEKLLDAAMGIVHEASQSMGMDFDQMGKAAGCASPHVGAVLASRKGCISGKDWERLITYCVLPEMWVYRAAVDVPPEMKLVSGGGGTQTAPSAEAHKKIRDLLSTTTWFYQEATRRFLQAGSESKAALAA
jgi:hypothetical protein